ncbi:uroporphyrinogen decarboxylase family protein [Acidobacteriota bacterium]
MTSRERVLAALNHKEPDRTPIDFSGHRSSGISAIVYPRLREYLGLRPNLIRVYDPIQQLAIVEKDVLDRFNVDTTELGRGFALDERDWRDWILPDGTKCQIPAWVRPEKQSGQWVIRSGGGQVIAAMPEGGLYFEQVHYPFLETADLETIPQAMKECIWWAVDSPPGPLTKGPDGNKRLASGVQKLRASTDRAIIGLFGGSLFETGQFLYRNDRFFMLLVENPKHVHAFLDRVVELHLFDLKNYLEAVGNSIDVILFGDDLGMQTGAMISPAMYREFFKPRHKMMWKQAKELADVKVMLHCCGGIRELIPDLIDAGLDAINPVQITARNMEAKRLKADFGEKIVFWGGGCDTQNILTYGTAAEVTKHVREQVQLLRPDGGFVFQQVHNILADVPPENIVAMFDAVNNP